MTSSRSIPAALCDVAAHGDPRRGFTFIDEGREAFYSFEEVARRAAQYAAAMLRQGLKRGDRVALALPDSAEFVFSFLGAMHAGLVPVPMYPPLGLGKLGFYLTHARHILRDSGASMLITSSQVKSILGSLIGGRLRSISTVDRLGIDNSEAPVARLRAEDIAFLQFTSGSTAQPKGVVLTYGMLDANARCISNGLKMTPDDVGCSWLPLYHDMGLIGFILTPIFTSTPVAVMPPFMFLKRPIEWLRRMTQYRATASFAPNFGYALCASRVRERDLESLDLSNWRVAGCGSEPIQHATIENFSNKFKSAGFKPEAFLLAYGLAENTLAVSFTDVETRPRAERVSVSALTDKHVAETASEFETESTVNLVSCGRQFPEHEIKIVDEDGEACAPRGVGEIVIRGPSMMSEYYGNPVATRAAIKDGWLHTGDLGFLLDGELFVCGRIKDLIIVAGRNYYPSDIELVVSNVSGVRRGRVVAFSLNGMSSANESEQVIVCAETKMKAAARERLSDEIQARVLESLGLKLSAVAQLERGCLPRTSSGKLQRTKTKQMYLEGTLDRAARNENKLIFLGHLAYSQWSFLKIHVKSLITRASAG
jgi:acyl-CoA synthetase (AMP-forming)/AMP-acid ligase II